MDTPLLKFYGGNETDNHGRTLEEMWVWSDEKLESCHNYIQWMFPSDERSSFNADAPVLMDTEIEMFLNNEHLQGRLRTSFETILAFYGFELTNNDGKLSVKKTERFSTKAKNWLTFRNHNHLRITRILKCLCLTGLKRYAEAFLSELEVIFKQNSDTIGEETLRYWRSAVM